MSNKVHIGTAIAAFLGIYWLLLQTNANIATGYHLFITLIVTAICSALPDIIEPAAHWRHRKFFHSWFVLKIMLLVSLVGLGVGLISGYYYLFFGPLGYSIHLLEDCITKAGLPQK
ncbi:MAG: metal-dependent hydrolase [Candidatus Thermoplasmatota archaeon]